MDNELQLKIDFFIFSLLIINNNEINFIINN